MEINPIGATAGESPDNLPGLIVQLDANSLTEANGSALYSWPDSSGGGHALDQARGIPSVTTSQALGGKKVVSFDGFSQLYSTYDFGSSLTEYTVLALARHTGESNETIVGSVGSDWVFGWGNGSSSYWKMGNTVAQSVPRGSDLAPARRHLRFRRKHDSLARRCESSRADRSHQHTLGPEKTGFGRIGYQC